MNRSRWSMMVGGAIDCFRLPENELLGLQRKGFRKIGQE